MAIAAHAAPCFLNPANKAESSSALKGRRLGWAGDGRGKRGVPSGCVERLGLDVVEDMGKLLVEEEAMGECKAEAEAEGEAARAREGGRCVRALG